MGVSSELFAEENAKRLERILEKGKEKNNPNITSFLKLEIYPLYLKEIKETFGLVQENKELRDYYFKK